VVVDVAEGPWRHELARGQRRPLHHPIDNHPPVDRKR
jgi:hypothetical protein